MLNSCLSNDSSVIPSSERALDSLKANNSSPSFNGLSFDQVFMKLMNSWGISMPWILRRTLGSLSTLGTKTHIPPLVPWLAPRQIPISFALLSLLLWLTSTTLPKGACRSAKKLNFSPVMISAGVLGVVLELGRLLWLLIILNTKRSYRAFGRVYHWEIDYRKIIGIYRNFDGKLLHSYFTTVSEVFLELIAPNLMILLIFR